MDLQHYYVDIDSRPLNTFKHAALPERGYIRLLRVTTAIVRLGDHMEHQACSLEAFPIKSAPSYLTLSYTWGPPLANDVCRNEYANEKGWMIADTLPEDVNDAKAATPTFSLMMIGMNLWCFLRRLPHISPPFYIWIDAICINQSDPAERSSQVAMMANIYARCLRTIIWLGEYHETGADVGKIYDLHVDIYNAVLTYMEDREPGDVGGEWNPTNLVTRLQLESAETTFDWAGYLQFFDERTWFRRSWVYQESIFTPRSDFMFANLVLEWEILTTVAQFLSATGLLNIFSAIIKSHVKDTPAEYFMVAEPWLANLERIRQQTRGVGTLTWLEDTAKRTNVDDLRTVAYSFWVFNLNSLRPYDATDKRDKIFAAYGFLQKALEPLDLIADTRTTPDYTKTIEQVYTGATEVALSEAANLSILCEVEDADKKILDTLPSWVPDFSVRHDALWHGLLNNTYHASTDIINRERSRTVRVSNSHLQLPGYKIGHVDRIEKTRLSHARPHWNGAGLELIHERILAWRSLLAHVTAYRDVSRWEALYYTLLTGTTVAYLSVPMTPHHFKATFLEWMMQLHDLRVHWDKTTLDEEDWKLLNEATAVDHEYLPTREEVEAYISQQDLQTTDHPNPSGIQLPHHVDGTILYSTNFRSAFLSRSLDRQLFVTDGGHLGSGPSSLQEGDEVWLVQGASTLFTVRQTIRRDYRLVGETYLYGCMHGELLEQAKGNWTDLTLR